MRPKLLMVFSILVLAPLALLAWIGVRGAQREREMVQRRLKQLFLERLDDAAARVYGVLRARERDFLRSVESLPLSADALRAFVRRTPYAEQIFVLGADGRRIHPPAKGPLTQSEREFLDRARQVWRDRQRFFARPERSASKFRRRAAAPAPAQGWYAWYAGAGAHWILWRRLDSGEVVGVELNRPRFIADVIAALLQNRPADPTRARVRLLDSKGDVLCQWGAYEPRPKVPPGAALRLRYPLHMWKLEYFSAGRDLAARLGRRARANLFVSLASAALALLVLAAYFYREAAREWREAAQRVTFVNQVSHELKTPLTNIRLYAELLAQRLPDDAADAARYVEIICGESQRLSRLIGNLLTFARGRRGALKLRPAPGVVDEVVARTLDHFRPALESKGVQIEFHPGAPDRVLLDADALEQMLGNLINNVEKYAADGGALTVRTRRDGDRVFLTVADRGPGVPPAQREAVFQPFYRLSDKLTDGVAGAGIGLAIVRELARLHGGDARLLPSDQGACFEIELCAPPA